MTVGYRETGSSRRSSSGSTRRSNSRGGSRGRGRINLLFFRRSSGSGSGSTGDTSSSSGGCGGSSTSTTTATAAIFLIAAALSFYNGSVQGRRRRRTRCLSGKTRRNESSTNLLKPMQDLRQSLVEPTWVRGGLAAGQMVIIIGPIARKIAIRIVSLAMMFWPQ